MDKEDPILGKPVELPGEENHSKEPAFKPRRNWSRILKKLFIRLLAVLIIAAAGLGIWKLIDSKKNNTASPQAQSTQQTSKSAQAASDVPDVDGTETFKSDKLLIELTHPISWKVTEAADGGVRIESPDFTYQTLSKGSVAGQFRIYIRKGARAQDSKYIGKGMAIKTSDQLTYSSPAPGQRSQTNLSAFGIDTPDNFAFFLIAGNFTLKKGDTLGPTYGKELDTYIIAGGYSAKDLTDDLAMNSVSVESYNKTKAYGQAVDILKSLKIK